VQTLGEKGQIFRNLLLTNSERSLYTLLCVRRKPEGSGSSENQRGSLLGFAQGRVTMGRRAQEKGKLKSPHRIALAVYLTAQEKQRFLHHAATVPRRSLSDFLVDAAIGLCEAEEKQGGPSHWTPVKRGSRKGTKLSFCYVTPEERRRFVRQVLKAKGRSLSGFIVRAANLLCEAEDQAEAKLRRMEEHKRTHESNAPADQNLRETRMRERAIRKLRPLSCFVTVSERDQIRQFAAQQRCRSISQYLIKAALWLGEAEEAIDRARAEKGAQQ
jgi:uncharacterized protein (DUF1778 family)